jgi:hypothetical protein
VLSIRQVGTLGTLIAKPARAVTLARCLSTTHAPIEGDAQHLAAAMAWLCRAQNAVPDGGVSYGFSLVDGWLPPYPETTGYCIPTFLAFARYAGRPEYRERARSMASWELRVQLPTGGIPGGWWVEGRDAPAISFDTGQVIQGWCAMYEAEEDARLLDAAIRAGRHLVRTQEPDGAWRDVAPGRAVATRFAFNARTSWPLLQLARLSGDDTFRSAALRNLDWTLAQQAANGWFRSAGFAPDEDPLTHTLAYVLEGLFHCWILTKEPALLDAVRRGSRPLVDLYVRDRRLPAVLGSAWQARDRSACVTGCAQMANLWLRLGDVDADAETRTAGRLLLDQVKGWQIRGSRDVDVAGALPGSIPIFRRYEPLRFPNWGAKFFCDALLTALGAGEP